MRMLGNNLIYGHSSDWPGRWWYGGTVLKSDCAAAYQPLGAPDAEHAYYRINALPSISTAHAPVAPTFNPAFGWQFDGATQYVCISHTVPPCALWPNTAVLVKFSDVTNSGHVYGSVGTETLWTSRWALVPVDDAGDDAFYRCGMNAMTSPGRMYSGVAGATFHNAYRNGVKVGTSSESGNLWISSNLFLGARNRGNGATDGTAEMFGAFKCQMAVIYHRTLTDTEMALISAQMAAYTA